jgi:hypothetical protein
VSRWLLLDAPSLHLLLLMYVDWIFGRVVVLEVDYAASLRIGIPDDVA